MFRALVAVETGRNRGGGEIAGWDAAMGVSGYGALCVQERACPGMTRLVSRSRRPPLVQPACNPPPARYVAPGGSEMHSQPTRLPVR